MHHQLSFREIVNIDELKKLFEAFSTATGFTTGLVDKTANEILIATGWRDICVKFHRANPASIEHCKSSGRILTEGLDTPGEVRICHCQNGLVDGCTPIIIEGQHLANLATGQIFFAPPEIERFKKQARQYGYDEQAYLETISAVPIVNEETFKAMLLFLSGLATTIAKIGLATLQSKKDRDEIASNKALLDSMLNSIPDLIFYKDHESKYLGANKAFKEFVEFGGKDIVGCTDSDFFPNEMTEFFRDQDLKTLVSCKSRHTEEMVTSPDGRKVLFDTLKTPYIGPSGDVLGLIGVSRDITNTKETEQKLKAIFETVSDGILVIDIENKKFLLANVAICEMLGYSSSEILQIDIIDIHPEKDISYVLEQLKKQLKQEIVVASDIPVKRKDGTLFYVDINSSPMPFAGKQCLLSVFRDITERKMAEKERRKLESKLQQAYKMEAIGSLAGGIAHDFNNILAAIFGYTELATIHIDNKEKLQDYLAEVRKAGERAKSLVQQILTFSRKSEQIKHPLQIALIVKEVTKLLRSSLPATIEIRQQIHAKEQTVLADSTQIHQILMNLCTNAHHAMRKTGGILGVLLQEKEIGINDQILGAELAPGRYLELEISDTGMGMNELTREKIFDPYFTTKETGEGTGLGLAVVHGIVKDHQGTILVYSEPGQGTIFRIYLPVVEEKARVEKQQETETITKHESGHILFVDDEEKILSIASDVFLAYGYQITTHSKPEEALASFAKSPDTFDLLITDMTMPQMTGVELAKKVMTLKPDFPVVLCTGYSELINKESALTLGIKEFISKPVVMSKMVTVIKRILHDGSVS